MPYQIRSTDSSKLQTLRILRPGDIIAFSGSHWTSDLINLGSFGVPRYSISHVAIIGSHPSKGDLLYQSCFTPSGPCAIQGHIVKGSQAQPIDTILDYKGSVWLYRLKRQLRFGEIRHLNHYLTTTIGRPYDKVGAWGAGGNLIAWLCSLLTEEHTSSLFCSEWVAAALREADRFDTRSVSRWSPNALIRELRNRNVTKEPVRIK